MNHKKRFFEQPWVEDEMRAMRSEVPDEEAVARAVRMVQETPTRGIDRFASRRWALAGAFVGLGACALVLFIATVPQQARAASLRQIANAVKAQAARHELVYRPDGHGHTKVMLETWIQDDRNKMVDYSDNDGPSFGGYDGRLNYSFSPKYGGFIDDTAPVVFPIASVEDYSRISGATMTVYRGERFDGRLVDRYSFKFSTGTHDLYVERGTHLPSCRIVLDGRGNLIERNVYDYPSAIPDATFAPPTGPGIAYTDYPALRRDAAKLLRGAGQKQVVAGVEVRLLAVIVGKRSVLVVWTGGSPVDSREKMKIEGISAANIDGHPVPQTPFVTFCAPPLNNAASPVFPSGGPFYGQIAWFGGDLTFGDSLAVSVPVRGDHAVGYARFKVMNPMHAADPQRVLWKPVGGVETAKSG